jgi:hypothetical protein
VHVNTTTPIMNTTQLNPQSAPDPSKNHMPTPTAAFAVPLSFVGVILLGSFFLCFHHRRKLKLERAMDAQRISATKEKQTFKLTSPSTAPSLVYLSRSSSLEYLYDNKGRIGDNYTATPVSYSQTRRQGQPRQSTRQPFSSPLPTTLVTAPTIRRSNHSPYAAHPTLKTTYSIPSSTSPTVPASLFRAAAQSSPKRPPGLGKRHLSEDSAAEEAENASINHDVISNYLAPSPIPPCLSPGMPSQPGKLHVRNEAARLFDFDKALPMSPRPYTEDSAYRAVADVVRTKQLRDTS